jgi:MarR family transcriptional regulator, organic hydroperoxide resistance regulator
MTAPIQPSPKPQPRAPARPFVEDYLLYLLARASAGASAEFHAVVKRRGLAVVEWRVLGALEGGRRTVGELAAMTLVQQPTLTKIVDRMAAEGLVARRPDAHDGRRVYVEATAKGAALAADLIRLARRHEAEVLKGYSRDEAAALKRALRTLILRTGARRSG